MQPVDKTNPTGTQEYPFYPDTPLIRVHLSIDAVRRCPVCQHRIGLLHQEANEANSPRGFELKG